METTDQKLMDKKVDDITVRDAVKINVVAAALCVAVPVVFFAAASAQERIALKLQERKDRKATESPEDN